MIQGRTMPTPASGRAKRVTDPLDDKVKARLRGDVVEHHAPDGYPRSSSSSGSEHKAGDLSGLVQRFFFSDNESSDGDEADDAACDDEERGEGEEGLSDREGRRPSYCADPAAEMIRDLVNPGAASAAENRFRRDLAASVTEAGGAFAGLRANRPAFIRAVMGSLREMGYNAGICKSRCERGRGGLTTSSYEYVDVVTAPATATRTASPPQQQRYVVDVDFAGEFEIARPTVEYLRAVAELPRVYVGRPEDLRQLLRVLADAVRQSLRAREMHVPPWRKGRFMQAKWLGPYRRTFNLVPSGSSSAGGSVGTTAATPEVQSFGPGRGVVKCRFVGFDTVAPVVIPPATRMR